MGIRGGYVDKFEGDLIMALFGAKQATENDCVRAVACGLNMQETIREVKTGIDKIIDNLQDDPL